MDYCGHGYECTNPFRGDLQIPAPLPSSVDDELLEVYIAKDDFASNIPREGDDDLLCVQQCSPTTALPLKSYA